MYISSDTNIWIDFHEIDRLGLPFQLRFKYFISRHTFKEELLQPEELKVDLLNHGLQLTDVGDEELRLAIAFHSTHKQVSLNDAFAFAIAKNRNWILLSGDKPLHNAATSEGVECHGTIWVCDQLKEQGKVTDSEYGIIIEELIEAVNDSRCRLPMAELLRRRKSLSQQSDK